MSRSSANANTVPCPLTKIRQVRHASSSARIKAAECAGKREGRSVRPSSVVQPHARSGERNYGLVWSICIPPFDQKPVRETGT